MIGADSVVLITGADGFVGWHLLQHLQDQRWSNVHVTSYSQSARLVEFCGEDKVHSLDLTDSTAVQRLIKELQPEAIVHLAAWSAVGGSFDNAHKIMNLNIEIQLIMLEAIRDQAPQARLLSIGSGHAYGHVPANLDAWHITESYPFMPDNPYAVSKLTQEMLSRAYALAYNLDVVFVRPFNQIGPGQRGEFAVASFAEQIVAAEQTGSGEILVGNLDAIRDFTDVRDAAVAYRLLLEAGESGGIYNLGSGVGVSMRDVLDNLVELSSAKIAVTTDPKRIRPSDIPVFVADPSRIQALGWQPSYSLDETLRDILKEARQTTSEKTTE